MVVVELKTIISRLVVGKVIKVLTGKKRPQVRKKGKFENHPLEVVFDVHYCSPPPSLLAGKL